MRPDLLICIQDLLLVNSAKDWVTGQTSDFEVLQAMCGDEIWYLVLHDFNDGLRYWYASFDDAGEYRLSLAILLER